MSQVEVEVVSVRVWVKSKCPDCGENKGMTCAVCNGTGGVTLSSTVSLKELKRLLEEA